MRKRAGPVLIFLLVAALGFGQTINLNELNADIQTLFTSIGRDVSPSLHQMAVSGFDSVGEARLSGLTGFYFSPVSVSLTTFNGLAKVLNKDNDQYPGTWQFNLLSLPGLVKDLVASDPMAEQIFNTATTRTMLLPSLRLGFGFKLPWDLEFLVNGFYVPPALVNWGIDLASSKISGDFDLKALQAKVDFLTLGGTLRKVILSDQKGFWRPSLSLGASYVYSSMALGADNFSLEAIGVELGPEQTQGLGTVDMQGKIGFQTSSQAIGAVISLSKNILWIFTPFAKIATYYYNTNYQSDFKVQAVITPEDDVGEPESFDLDAPVRLTTQDVSIILSGGFELRLPLLAFVVNFSLDMEQPIVELKSLTLDGFTFHGLGATVGLRLQL